MECHRQASPTIVSRSARCGTHPSASRMRAADAYSTAGSPVHRGADRYGTTREWAASAILDYLTQNVDHCLYSYRTTEFHSDFFLCQKK